MKLVRVQYTRFLLACLSLGLLGGVAFAGPNEGFAVKVDPGEIKDPEPGQSINLTVTVEGTQQIFGTTVRVKYDPALFSFQSFVPGNLTVGSIPLTLPPEDLEDGFKEVEGGSALFTGAQASTGGTLGVFSFELIGELPPEGAFLSLTRVAIRASASEEDALTFAEGELGLAITRTVLVGVSGLVRDSDPGNAVAGALITFINPEQEASVATSAEDGSYALELPAGLYDVSILPPEGALLRPTRLQVSVPAENLELELDLVVEAILPNKLFDLVVTRRFNAATLTWNSRFAGIDDEVRFRAVGETDYQTAQIPLRQRATPEVQEALRTLRMAGVEVEGATPAALQEALGREISPPFIASLTLLDEALRTRRHLAILRGLLPDTEYEFEVRSISLDGQLSPRNSGRLRTRKEPDLRPVVIADVDAQTTLNSATVRWFTNRRADTRYRIEKLDAENNPVATIIDTMLDEDGTQFHLASVAGLEAGTTYRAILSSTGINLEELLADGLLAEKDISDSFSDIFRTLRRRRLLRLIAPPSQIIGAESAVISFRLNQIATARIDYGLVGDRPVLKAAAVAPIASNTEDPDAELYTWTAESTDFLNGHSITLSNLDPATRYRYRITVVTPEGEIFSTTPSGNARLSGDLQLTTSAAADTLPAEVIEGPGILARDRIAVLRFVTDVETTSRVFFGTLGSEGTLGTPDEFEVIDQTPNGKPRFAQKHILNFTGLNPGTDYGFRIEITAANGKVTLFDPLSTTPAARRARAAKILQPPGGAGSFLTDAFPDTQFPVILSGPTVSSKTNDSAVLEWSTDEPANSEIRFGTGALDDFSSSGDNELTHKLILSDLKPGTSYSYIVASTDASGNGATESAQAVFTTNPDLDLTAPILTVEPKVVYKNDRGATIQWTTDEEATARVEFGLDQALGFIRTSPTTQTLHEITLTNLEPGTTYFYQASSTDLSNNGPTSSAVLSFSTDAAADLDSPILDGIEVAASDSAAIISWGSDELADSFVEFSTDENMLEFTVGDVKDALTHEITLTNLEPGTTYFFRAGSTDRANNPPSLSEVSSFTTLAAADTTPPAVPTNLSGTIGARQVALRWDAELELDLAGFNVYRRVGDEDFTLIVSRLRDNEFTDLNVDNDITYEYRITAIDRETPPNESAFSASVQLTPTASAAPTTPVDLSRSGDDFLRPTFVFTNATPFNAGAALSYTLQVSTEADFSNVTASISGLEEGAGDAGPGQTAWPIDRPLNEGQTYFWRVRAVEGTLIGPFSAAQQFIAQEAPALPGDFNGDNAVNFDDFFLFVDVFGQPATGANAVFDLSGNGQVDFDDFFLFTDNFGKTAAGKPWGRPQSMDEEALVRLEALGGRRQDERQVVVRAWGEHLRQLKAFGLVLHYDPSQLRFEEAVAGAGHLLESKGGSAPLFGVFFQRPGQVVVGNGLIRGEAVSGQGLLAELHFVRLGDSTRPLVEVSEALVASSGTEVRRVGQLRPALLRPQNYALNPNFPNPFNPSTSIEYTLPQASPVKLSIYNVLGQEVRTLVRETEQRAGFYRALWDGRDNEGRPVGNGLYLFRLEAGSFTQTRKMTLIK